MKICVEVRKNWLNTVVHDDARELRDYKSLSAAERLEILTEVFQRAFLAFWLYGSKKTEWNRRRITQNKKGKTESFGTDNEQLPQTVMLYSKALVSGGSVGEEENLNEKKVPKATAKANFSFDMQKSILHVEVTDVVTENSEDRKAFESSLESELRAAKVAMESYMGMDRFLKTFFDTLHIRRITSVMGGEAVTMHRIYKNAMQSYPLFKGLSYNTRIDLLRKGYRSARAMSGGSRDIHSFAKATFEAFDAQGGVLGKVYTREAITNKYKTFTKVYENRRNRCNPENPSQIWESNSLIFAEYEHPIADGSATLRTSFLAFDLWDLLARSEMVA